MPISQGGATLAIGGINAVVGYFANKGVASAAKDTAKAQRRLLDLQAEEQKLKNRALQMTLDEQNQDLPFAISNPSLPKNAYSGNVKPDTEGSPGPAPTSSTAGTGAFLALLVAGAAVGALALTKSARV